MEIANQWTCLVVKQTQSAVAILLDQRLLYICKKRIDQTDVHEIAAKKESPVGKSTQEIRFPGLLNSILTFHRPYVSRVGRVLMVVCSLWRWQAETPSRYFEIYLGVV